jgi:hypothetical protein
VARLACHSSLIWVSILPRKVSVALYIGRGLLQNGIATLKKKPNQKASHILDESNHEIIKKTQKTQINNNINITWISDRWLSRIFSHWLHLFIFTRICQHTSAISNMIFPIAQTHRENYH